MAAAPTAVAPALADADTREELRRRGRRAAVVTLLCLISLVAFVVGAVRVGDGSAALRDHGLVTTGVVVSLQPDTRGSTGSARVSYVAGGRRITGHQDLGSDAGRYVAGQAVTVHYDPHRPTRFTIDGEDNQAGWTVWAMAFALVAGLGVLPLATAALVSWWRDRRVLARHPWWHAQVAVTFPTSQYKSAFVGITSVDAPGSPSIDARTSRRGGVQLQTACERYGRGAIRVAGPQRRALVVAVRDADGRDRLRLVRLNVRPGAQRPPR